MMRLVLDASVIVKWLVPEYPQEAHTPQALHILQEIKHGHLTVLQPPHWLAEIAAVMARLEPRIARDIIQLLYAMELPVANDIEMYDRACELSIEFGVHVFDTLYHAVALSDADGLLVTADEQYFRKASKVGRVLQLQEFPMNGMR